MNIDQQNFTTIEGNNANVSSNTTTSDINGNIQISSSNTITDNLIVHFPLQDITNRVNKSKVTTIGTITNITTINDSQNETYIPKSEETKNNQIFIMHNLIIFFTIFPINICIEKLRSMHRSTMYRGHRPI